jgi:hypothetical protein
MSRETRTLTDQTGGCWTCSPDGRLIWEGKNAMACAARHHDATGHPTWAEQHLTVRYGPRTS